MAPNTYFLDIDGTLLLLVPTLKEMMTSEYIQPLQSVVDKIMNWHRDGCRIILTTARPSTLRDITTVQLRNAGIVYDQLIMDVGNGPRILVNDYLDEHKAFAYNVYRNIEGLALID